MEHQPYKLSHSIKTALNKCWRFFSFLFSIFHVSFFVGPRWSKVIGAGLSWACDSARAKVTKDTRGTNEL